jgi:hypothetical protein
MWSVQPGTCLSVLFQDLPKLDATHRGSRLRSTPLSLNCFLHSQLGKLTETRSQQMPLDALTPFSISRQITLYLLYSHLLHTTPCYSTPYYFISGQLPPGPPPEPERGTHADAVGANLESEWKSAHVTAQKLFCNPFCALSRSSVFHNPPSCPLVPGFERTWNFPFRPLAEQNWSPMSGSFLFSTTPTTATSCLGFREEA